MKILKWLWSPFRWLWNHWGWGWHGWSLDKLRRQRINPNRQAIKQFMDFWKKVPAKRGRRSVASPSKFDTSKLKDAAAKARMQFLRAKQKAS